MGCEYIGCQRVDELDGDRAPFFQTRFWARVDLEPFAPTHEMTGRKLVLAGDFLNTLFWGRETTAALILERGLSIEGGFEPTDQRSTCFRDTSDQAYGGGAYSIDWGRYCASRGGRRRCGPHRVTVRFWSSSRSAGRACGMRVAIRG